MLWWAGDVDVDAQRLDQGRLLRFLAVVFSAAIRNREEASPHTFRR